VGGAHADTPRGLHQATDQLMPVRKPPEVKESTNGKTGRKTTAWKFWTRKLQCLRRKIHKMEKRPDELFQKERLVNLNTEKKELFKMKYTEIKRDLKK